MLLRHLGRQLLGASRRTSQAGGALTEMFATATGASAPQRYVPPRASLPLLCVPQLGGCRWLSTTQGKSAKEEEEQAKGDPALAAEKKKKLQMYNGAMMGAGGVVVYGISAAVHKMVSTFMGLNFTTVAWVGWAGGFVSASIAAGGAYTLKKMMEIRPQLVYYHCMDVIRASALAESTLGSKITTGTENLRAYRVDGGHLSVGDSMRPVWLPPRCQMIFQVHGSNGYDALATVECVKERGSLVVNLLCLDVCNTAEDVLFIEGKEERMHVKDQLRGFVDFKKDKTH